MVNGVDTATKVQFFLRTRVKFGNGTFATVGTEAAALGRTVLVVTGRSAMRRAGLTQKLVAQLEAAGARAVLYEGASPNPTTVEVDDGAELARREQVEAVVGLGGGSAMDVAKAIATVVSYNKSCYELCGEPLPVPGLPVVAVPTTAGTGAEVSGVAVVTEPARRLKATLRSPAVAPALAVIDPELTVTLPPKVTASSGLDALAHAVESYLSRNASPFTEPFAERATGLVFEHLKAACDRGEDLAARTGMALGSLMAGVTLAQAGVILGHGVGMVLGGFFGTDHGATVGVLLPAVLEQTLPGSAGRLAQLGRRSGVLPATASLSDEEAARALIQAVRELLAGLPLPRSLGEMGCRLTDVPTLVARVIKQGSTPNYPIPLTEAAVEAFLRRVLPE